MKKLDQRSARRIREALLRLAETGRGDVAKLIDVDPPQWRLRVGAHRAIFRYQEQPKTIQVLRVRHRDQAY